MMRHRALAGALAILLLPGACGDDDDGNQAANSTTTAEATTTSTGEALCAAIDDLEQDIGALGDIDVLAEGTDAVEASLTTIRNDLAEIRDLAPDIAPDEAGAFDDALASLDDAITAIREGPITAESAQDVVAAGASTVEAGQAYLGGSTTRARDPTATRGTGAPVPGAEVEHTQYVTEISVQSTLAANDCSSSATRRRVHYWGRTRVTLHV